MRHYITVILRMCRFNIEKENNHEIRIKTMGESGNCECVYHGFGLSGDDNLCRGFG